VVSLIRRRTGWSQTKASVIIAVLCYVTGIGTVLSFNLWAQWHPLAGQAWAGAQTQGTLFDLLDYLTSNLLLPLVGLGIAIVAGWVMPRQVLVEQLHLTPTGALVLGMLLRWVVPAGIAAVALATVVG
jgi:NSS family neurotransmitter:Na+ symporter